MVSVKISGTMIIFDFNQQRDISDWEIVNDSVMGGQSSSKFYLNDEGNGIFTGKVSLENNGGFASVRHRFNQKKIAGYKKVIIRIKGDGKRYQFRAKTKIEDQQAYISYFGTTGEWQTVEIILSALEPTFRGRKLNMPNFPVEKLEEVGFMFGNKANENFELVINEIYIV